MIRRLGYDSLKSVILWSSGPHVTAGFETED
jgi:hypothetical protein